MPILWMLFDLLGSPSEYAFTYRNGEFYFERVEVLIARGDRVIT